LISLCLFIAAEAIPRLIETRAEDMLVLMHDMQGKSFLIITGIGLGVNTFGTLAFAAAGASHGHSHGGGGHGHGGHGGKEKKEKHGHAHGEGKKDTKSKDKKSKGSAIELEDHDDDGHGHGAEEHGHSHGEKKKDKEHGHGHGEKKKDKGDHGHAHSSKDKHGHDDHAGHSEGADHNLMAVFLHYLGDAVSSLFVLVLGLLIYYLPGCCGFEDSDFSYGPDYSSNCPKDTCASIWLMNYGDPVASLLIIGLILITTVPLIKGTANILMQSIPPHLNVGEIKEQLQKIRGVAGVHDLHCWQLVDGLMIGTVHIGIEEGANITFIYKTCKQIFHNFGVHSTTIQPEVIPGEMIAEVMDHCEENCVEGCAEAWCCKTEAELAKQKRDEFAIFAPI